MDNVTSSKESPILKSKKFVAAMTWNTGWLILLSLGIVYSVGDTVLLSMTWVAGATQITYIGGQAALDTFVRKAAILAGGQNSSQKVEEPFEKEHLLEDRV